MGTAQVPATFVPGGRPPRASHERRVGGMSASLSTHGPEIGALQCLHRSCSAIVLLPPGSEQVFCRGEHLVH